MTGGDANARMGSSEAQLPAALAQLENGPIFVIGQPRSGTTWVYDMLSGHPEVAGAFESWLFTSHLGVANLFRDAHFEHDVETFGRQDRLGQLISRERLVHDVRELTAEWLAEALKPGHRFLVEKTPSHYEEIPVLEQLFPQARYIHVIRDGRDVVVSMMAASRTWAKGHIEPSVRAHARAWDVAVRTSQTYKRDLGSRYIEVRYEALKASPTVELARLFDFCSIPHDEGLLKEVAEGTDFARLPRKPDTGFRRRGEIGDWRGTLGLRQRVEFVRGSRTLLVELGYERSRWWFLRPPGLGRTDEST